MITAHPGMPMPGPDAGPHWTLLAALVPAVLAVAYGAAALRLHRRGDRWPVLRTVSGLTGSVALTVALLPPLVDADDFRLHVLQHLLSVMLAPLALALSAPVTLALRTLPARGRRVLLSVVHSRVAAAVTLAPVVLVLDLGGTAALYLTPLFGAVHAHPALHLLVHGHMVLAGCLLSWYLVARDPMPHRPSTTRRLAVLVVAAAGHDVLAKVLYAGHLPRGADDPGRLQAGARLLFYGGDLVDVLLAVAVMSAWYARSGRRLRHERRRASTVPAGPRSTAGAAAASR